MLAGNTGQRESIETIWCGHVVLLLLRLSASSNRSRSMKMAWRSMPASEGLRRTVTVVVC
jgi:hypothetical protein